MDKQWIHNATVVPTPARSEANLWVPHGLLQGITNKIYQDTHRKSAQDETERQRVEDIISHPAEVALVRVRSPDLVTSTEQQRCGNAMQTLQTSPHEPLRILPGSLFEGRWNDSVGNETYRARSRSIAIANLQRRHYEGVIKPPQNVFTTRKRERASSINIASLQRGHVKSSGAIAFHAPPRRYTPSPTSDAIDTDAIVPPEQDHGYADLKHLQFDSNSTRVRDSYTGPLSPIDCKDDQKTVDNASVLRKASITIANTFKRVLPGARKSSVWLTYERAKLRQKQLQRSKPVMIAFQYGVYLLLLGVIYFVLVGRPLWDGLVWKIYLLFENDLTFSGGSAIFVGLAFLYAFGPLLLVFENPARIRFDPHPAVRGSTDKTDCALIIPCYKSEEIIGPTLEAALDIFPAENIFVIANGNSPTPLDDTEAVCTRYGVNHVWSPIGSKIVAQYVGCYVAKRFKYILLIDDDCALPPNFPIVTDRLRGNIMVVGYTIKSVGANSTRGNWCQQAQDLEYKLSGLQRQFAGVVGSATFPHGAIALWDRNFLARTFQEHPGFSVSEDWFFGHVARVLGSRCVMCSSVFVETETPSSVFFSGGGARGGFGEMTVFKQRFSRWNFFFVNGMYYNMKYILFSWNLGWWELGAKLFVFQEVYETLLYLITPLVLPISFIVRPLYTLYLFLGTFAMYLLNSVLFNEIHLRLVGERVDRCMLFTYYMGFKCCLTFVNVLSCWWSLWQYAKYFAKRHPKIIEDERSVGLVLRIEEEREEEEFLEFGKELEKGFVHAEKPNGYGMVSGRLMYSAWQNRVRTSRRMTITAMKVEAIPDSLESNDVLGGDVEITVVEAPPSDTTHSGIGRLSHEYRGSAFSGHRDDTAHSMSPGRATEIERGVVVLDVVAEEDSAGMNGYSFYGI